MRKIGPHLYNFWQDAQNPRGIWRRTTRESYKLKEPEWETLLDFDALGKEEGVSWVYKGHTLLEEEGEHKICFGSNSGASERFGLFGKDVGSHNRYF